MGEPGYNKEDGYIIGTTKSMVYVVMGDIFGDVEKLEVVQKAGWNVLPI